MDISDKGEQYEEYFANPTYNTDDARRYLDYRIGESRNKQLEIERLENIVNRHKLFADKMLIELRFKEHEGNAFEGKQIYNQNEAAEILNISVRKVLELIKNEKLSVNNALSTNKVKQIQKYSLMALKHGITQFLQNSPDEIESFSISILNEKEEEFPVTSLYFNEEDLRQYLYSFHNIKRREKLLNL